MTDPTNPARAARIAALLDAATVATGIVATSVGVGAYDWRAGLVAFGSLLLVAEVVAARLRR